MSTTPAVIGCNGNDFDFCVHPSLQSKRTTHDEGRGAALKEKEAKRRSKRLQLSRQGL
jgi:hypothetical protein